MRRVREILRYRFDEGLGHKAISHRVGADLSPANSSR